MHGPVAEPSLAELSNGSVVMNMVSPPACKRSLSDWGRCHTGWCCAAEERLLAVQRRRATQRLPLRRHGPHGGAHEQRERQRRPALDGAGVRARPALAQRPRLPPPRRRTRRRGCPTFLLRALLEVRYCSDAFSNCNCVLSVSLTRKHHYSRPGCKGAAGAGRKERREREPVGGLAHVAVNTKARTSRKDFCCLHCSLRAPRSTPRAGPSSC